MMTDRLHVCLVNLSFGENSAGGVMHHMVALARELHAGGDSISVVCPAYGEPWRYCHEGIIDVVGVGEVAIDRRLAPAMIGFGWRTRNALFALHREKPVDIIHLHDRPPWLGATAAARRLGAPLVYTAHSLVAKDVRAAPLSTSLARALERRIARSRIPVIAVSQWVRRGFIELGAHPERVVVIPNGVDTDAFSYRAIEGRQADAVLFVGRLEREKGVDILLRAVALLAPLRRVDVMIAGEGSMEGSYRRLATDLGIGGSVHFVGRRSTAQLIAAFQSAAVCALPSRREPFGMVMLEAMSAGAPFVGTDVGGIGEVVDSGETGLLVPTDDPHALAAALGRLLDDRSLAARLSRNARSLVERRYSWVRVAAETRQVYLRQERGRLSVTSSTRSASP